MIAKLFPLLFDAADAGGGGGALGDVDDITADLAVLNDGGDDKDGDAGDDGKGDEDDPDKDLDKDLKVLESDEDDEEKDEEEEEDPDKESDDKDKDDDKDDKEKDDKEVIEGRPSIKQLRAIAPDIFKRAPGLKDIYFREQAFSESGLTPEEVGDAASKAGNYDKLEESLVNGDPSLLMRELHSNNPEALKKVAAEWLPKLRGLDEDLYMRVTTPIVEELCYHAFSHGQKIGDKNLQASARHLMNYVFANGGEINDITKRTEKTEHPAEKQLREEREKYSQTRFTEADGEIKGRLLKSLDQGIRQGLDPDDVMTDRIKANIVRDVIEDINRQLSKDKAFATRMKTSWMRAKQTDFSRESKDSIVNAFLSGAKPLLRSVRNRIRAEVLGSKSKDKLDDKEPSKDKQPRREEKRTFKGSNRPGDQRRTRGSVLDPTKIDYRRTSDLDIINDEGGSHIKVKK